MGWRRRSGKTFTDLAYAASIDPSYLSLVMNGHRAWSMAVGLAIHRETGIAVEKLLSKSELQVLRDYLAETRTHVQIPSGIL